MSDEQQHQLVTHPIDLTSEKNEHLILKKTSDLASTSISDIDEWKKVLKLYSIEDYNTLRFALSLKLVSSLFPSLMMVL